MPQWGAGNIYKRGDVYWITTYIGGKRIRESTGVKTEHEAVAYLERRRAGLPGSGEDAPRTVNDLLDALEVDYRLGGKLDPRRVTYRLTGLRKHFGRMRAEHVTGEVITAYIRQRHRQGRTNGTINRELNILRRAFTYGAMCGRVEHVPRVVRLPEQNVRKGFFTAEEVERLCEELPPYLRDFTRFAFITGWRKGEIRGLRWADVDRKRGEIRLWTSKNGEGRVITFNPTLLALITRRWDERNGDYVFHFHGRQVGDFKKAWRSACIRAGLPTRVFHDFRRSAVREMTRAGISRQVAKRITGHKTDSVFDRYHIVADDDIRDAMNRLGTMAR